MHLTARWGLSPSCEPYQPAVMLENTLGTHAARLTKSEVMWTLWPLGINCVSPNQVPLAYSEPHLLSLGTYQ